MTPLGWLSLPVSIGTGYLLVSLFWPRSRGLGSAALTKGFLGVGVGLGISSTVFFLWLVLFGPARTGFILAETILLSVLIVLWSWRPVTGRSGLSGTSHPVVSESPKGLPIPVHVVFYFVLASAVVGFVLVSLENTHGGWDAWGIWNLRARFLFRGGDQWRIAFSPLLGWTHPDYPLLLPGAIARGWFYNARVSQAIPIILSMLFTFSSLGLMVSALAFLRSPSQGFLAGLALLTTPSFVAHGASQYADVPMGFYVLATGVFLSLRDRFPESKRGFSFLAGLAAGFSAWTKNEGFIFMGAVLVACVVIKAYEKGWKPALGEFVYFLIGLAPMVILIIYFKTQLAPPNDLLSSLELKGVALKLLDISRYSQIAKALGGELRDFGGGLVNPLPVLVMYLLCLGVTLGMREKRSVAAFLLALGLTFLGYLIVYLLSPYDLEWHLFRSLKRLLMQLWPSLLFTVFLMVRSPEQMLSLKASPEKSS